MTTRRWIYVGAGGGTLVLLMLLFFGLIWPAPWGQPWDWSSDDVEEIADDIDDADVAEEDVDNADDEDAEESALTEDDLRTIIREELEDDENEAGLSEEQIRTIVKEELEDVEGLSAADIEDIVDEAIESIETVTADDIRKIINDALSDLDTAGNVTTNPPTGNTGGNTNTGTNNPPSNSGGNPPANTGGETIQTSCGVVEWGPAGPAPGAFTNDSPAQVAEAVQVMQAEASRDHVTVHKFCAGDDTPNGWIVGSSWTESQGIQVSANFLPAGVCVDYDHNVTTISGDTYHTEVLNPRWSRTQLKSDGSATGLKFTVYWTPCVFTDGTPLMGVVGQSQSAPVVQPDSAESGNCTIEYLATQTGTNADNWVVNAQYSHGFIYNGPETSFAVPQGWHKVDYDGGSAMAGDSVPSGIVFTAWCRP